MKPFKDLPHASEILEALGENAKYIDVNQMAPENMEEFIEKYSQYLPADFKLRYNIPFSN